MTYLGTAEVTQPFYYIEFHTKLDKYYYILLIIKLSFSKEPKLILCTQNGRNKLIIDKLYRYRENITLVLNRGIAHESNLLGNQNKVRLMFSLFTANVNEKTPDTLGKVTTNSYGYTKNLIRTKLKMK